MNLCAFCLLDALVDQEQLEQILQQQQAEVQSRLDLMNEKMENWVVQCFSDLRTRIIDLVRPPTSLLPVHLPCLHCMTDRCQDCWAVHLLCLHCMADHRQKCWAVTI